VFLPHVARPAVTVDIVVLTVLDGLLQVLLIERGGPPFLGQRALPGGFVRVEQGGVGGESLDEAAARELHEETGLAPSRVLLEQIGVFGRPGRDPRGRTITVAFMALVSPTLAAFVRAGSDAAAACFIPVATAKGLAFDHDAIVQAALGALHDDVRRGGPLAFALVPDPFTIPELQAVHEVLLGTTLHDGPFRRRFDRLVDDGVVVRATGQRVTGRRPAAVYSAVTPPRGVVDVTSGGAAPPASPRGRRARPRRSDS
jgi:8-oxo-dGTP diphosphatase